LFVTFSLIKRQFTLLTGENQVILCITNTTKTKEKTFNIIQDLNTLFSYQKEQIDKVMNASKLKIVTIVNYSGIILSK